MVKPKEVRELLDQWEEAERRYQSQTEEFQRKLALLLGVAGAPDLTVGKRQRAVLKVIAAAKGIGSRDVAPKVPQTGSGDHMQNTRSTIDTLKKKGLVELRDDLWHATALGTAVAAREGGG